VEWLAEILVKMFLHVHKQLIPWVPDLSQHVVELITTAAGKQRRVGEVS